jgi:hypothetical protein
MRDRNLLSGHASYIHRRRDVMTFKVGQITVLFCKECLCSLQQNNTQPEGL